MPGEAWSDREIDLIVGDYFAMLADDLAGQEVNKAEHNRALQRLTGRSKGSVEFKHQNISAVLYYGFGQPWLPGYKPARNFQLALVDGVWRWLRDRPDWMPVASSTARHALAAVGEAGRDIGHNRIGPDRAPLWIGPPPDRRNEPPPVDLEFMAAIARKYDVAERDARNRALGKAGERLVVEHERAMLLQAGKEHLAAKVRWTAEQDGDGYGYDIASFESDGRSRLIEVKTTNGWERTPFHISRNEIAVAGQRRDEWHLLRLWNFARDPQVFALRPPLEEHVYLTPTSFLAGLH